MKEDIAEEDYVDDPIRLFDYEQSRVCYTGLADRVIEDPGLIINTTKEEETFGRILSECRNKTSLLPKTFFENDRNVELLSECCPVTINVVDCDKFVSYSDKTKDVQISSNDTDVNQNLTYNYINLPKRTTENTTEVISKQVFDQINLKIREPTSIDNVDNKYKQSAITNNNKGHKIKNSLADVLNCPNLGTPIKSLNDKLNVNRDRKQLMNNLKQTSNERKCAVEKEINNILEKKLADIKSVKINKPITKVIEQCQYKSISRTDIAAKTVNLSSSKKKPTKDNKNYDEQIMKFKMSDINRNESLKTQVMSNHGQKIDNSKAPCVPHLPPKLPQTKTLNTNASTTRQCIQNKPCTKVTCDNRFFSGNIEIPHYHNISSTSTVVNRQQEHNSNKTNCAPSNFNSLNKGISNWNMNGNYISNNYNIPSNFTPNKFISPCGSNYVTSHNPKDNSPNMRISMNGYENPLGLREASKGMSVIQTNNDQIPSLVNQNQLINANNPQNFSMWSNMYNNRNNFPQTYLQPPPPYHPLNPHIYNGNLHPPINNILRGSGNLPLVVQNQPIAHSNIDIRHIVRPNLQPQTPVRRPQSFMENKEGMIDMISLKNHINVNNLNYLIGTSTSTDQVNHGEKIRGYENKNIVIPNKHPHLVKAIEGQPMKNNAKDNNITKHPHLLKALEGQSVHSNSVTDNGVELIKINQNEPTKRNKVNNTACKPKTSMSDYKTVNNGAIGEQQSDNSSKLAKIITTTKDIKQKQLNNNKVNKPNTTNVGYSPPILPIPSYQKVFEILSKIKYYYFEGDKMYVNTEKTNEDIDYDIPLQSLPKKPILKKADKRKIEDENEKLPRKITINEYKDRGQSVVNNKVDVKKVRK